VFPGSKKLAGSAVFVYVSGIQITVTEEGNPITLLEVEVSGRVHKIHDLMFQSLSRIVENDEYSS
jgi:hypothetical protein